MYHISFNYVQRADTLSFRPPYDNDGEYWADVPRKSARLALKSLGLPASYEVGVLARVIQNLRSQLELDFGIIISEAVFTSSHLLALYQDDLEDAAEYVGIKYVAPRWNFQPIFWETAAAYAGHGLGLCKHWRDEHSVRQFMPSSLLALTWRSRAPSQELESILSA